MEPLKHECGVAMVRLLKPLAFYKEKYGTWQYGLNKLYLLMEKQHNRGQEAAGAGCIKMHSPAGSEYVFRERALGSGAISEIFSNINHQIENARLDRHDEKWIEEEAPFIGEIYMGHLRYSTTGRSGMSYVHPFLRRNNWCSRSLMLCGNFNMTNVESIFSEVVAKGQHPRIFSDTVIILEQLGYALDKENNRLYHQFTENGLDGIERARAIEDNLDIPSILNATAPSWDGGYVICGAIGSGDMWALRDSHGIRPAFYYADDEIVVVASERPVIQTVMDVHIDDVHELAPGAAVIVSKSGDIRISRVIPEADDARCSFERIYFSRGSDADIYRERKSLGRQLAAPVAEALDGDLQHAVFSFIPNTAEVAFIGMVEGLEEELDSRRASAIMKAQESGTLTQGKLCEIMSRKLRVEKVAIKDIKLRTFIAEGSTRADLATHVYDVTYGVVEPGVDSLVVIDDSIVRGTTLKQSILRMLDRLSPRRIVVVSSSPQVRYPDCYGIDMSRMSEFCAFRAAVALLKESGRTDVLDDVYRRCLMQESLPDSEITNCVKEIYAPFTDDKISAKIAEMLTPTDTRAEVRIIYQTLDGLHKAVLSSPGDWYFSGNYPTPGGTRLVNRAFVNYYEGHPDRRN
ncbi:amidophosphoribosyltransferase [uncultured Muribaculum sp.]|uniref:amidophosphoribosyltransferase n=1 Tax=uncultured Muribaculum sp. TaxID=1918613 RepID=UPI0025EEED03|nr:amidophosphoribosyltransferase [uncultured Muribaculum sp.]